MNNFRGLYLIFVDYKTFAIFNKRDGIVKKVYSQIQAFSNSNIEYDIGKKNSYGIQIAKHSFIYNPEWSGWTWHNLRQRMLNKLKKVISNYMHRPMFYDYDTIWKNILKYAVHTADNEFLSAFVGYDDSPRRGEYRRIVKNASPQKFEYYISKLLKISQQQRKEFLFLTAWNEWAEGGILEPTEKYGYAYLNAIKMALNNTGEWPF